jgi:hypothetical protein
MASTQITQLCTPCTLPTASDEPPISASSGASRCSGAYCPGCQVIACSGPGLCGRLDSRALARPGGHGDQPLAPGLVIALGMPPRAYCPRYAGGGAGGQAGAGELAGCLVQEAIQPGGRGREPWPTRRARPATGAGHRAGPALAARGRAGPAPAWPGAHHQSPGEAPHAGRAGQGPAGLAGAGYHATPAGKNRKGSRASAMDRRIRAISQPCRSAGPAHRLSGSARGVARRARSVRPVRTSGQPG